MCKLNRKSIFLNVIKCNSATKFSSKKNPIEFSQNDPMNEGGCVHAVKAYERITHKPHFLKGGYLVLTTEAISSYQGVMFRKINFLK